MRVVKYYCDCCKKEVESQEELFSITRYSDFKAMQDNDYPYENLEICQVCKNKVDKSLNEIIKKLSK